jgi:pimeloyl-ACP methyl ester carboxylesterase
VRTRGRSRIGRIVLVALALLALAIVVLNWTWGRLPGEPRMTGRIVHVGGVKVRVLEQSGSEPAVVFLHGLPGTADDFDRVAPLLRGRHTIAFDRPGFGFSSGGYHGLDEQMTTLRALIARLGARRPVLVGHSYGGTLALEYALRHPRELSGLVLVDAAAAGEQSNGFQRAQSRFIQFLSWPVVQQLADVTFSQLVRTASTKQGDAEAFDPGSVDSRHEHRLLALNMSHEDLDAYAAEQLAADRVIADLDKRLASIATPAIVIHGAHDKLVKPEHGRKLAATLPHAQLKLVSGGHMAPYVHPGVVAAAARRLAEGAR